MNKYLIGSEYLHLHLAEKIVSENFQLGLSTKAIKAIKNCRNFLDKKPVGNPKPVYGINTGFGYLQDVIVPDDKLILLQHNLLLSHACGTGEMVKKEIIKLMILFKIQSLSYGHSGVSLQLVERLVYMYNNNILPVVYTQGSLGASGDLAPLAHLSLPIIGEGEVWINNKITFSGNWYSQTDLKPLKLKSKEGLALINGTQFMTAYGIHILIRSKKLSKWADMIGALSADVFNCRLDSFIPLSHRLRPHPGQIETADKLCEILYGSELMHDVNKQVQDPYSFRCMPQVHGASKDALAYALKVFDIEVNSVTDNPNIFPDEDEIISAGNFHGQPLAIAFDLLCIALAELGSISERRTFQLISGQRGLPNFLVKNAGLNSGLMIPQYTAASIASENKQLCTPSSIDSIVSSNGQEDHVSMGANGATKCLRVVDNLEKILAIELLTACQGLEFRRPLKTSPQLERLVAAFRQQVTFQENDHFLSKDIQLAIEFIKIQDDLN